MNRQDPDPIAVFTEALADAGPRVPDYSPRNRLEPRWCPGVGVHSRVTPEPVDVAGPSLHGERSMAGEIGLLPGQRTMLLLLVLTGVAALGLLGYGMSGPHDIPRWSAPAARVQEHEDGRSNVMAPLHVPEVVNSVLAHPDGSDAAMAPRESGTSVPKLQSQGRPQSTLSIEADVARLRAALAASTAPEAPTAPEVPTRAEAIAGIRSALVVEVTQVPAVPAPARAEAGMGPAPGAMPSTSGAQAMRNQRSGPQTTGMECSEAQKAMQLCGIGKATSR